jgi:hypothetical protein
MYPLLDRRAHQEISSSSQTWPKKCFPEMKSYLRMARRNTPRTKMGSSTYSTIPTQFVRLTFLFCLVIGAVKADLCPDFSPTQDEVCVDVSNWSEFLSAIEESTSGDLFLCPFKIDREETDEPAIITRGINIRCKRRLETDLCIIHGPGTHLKVATSDDTSFQGLSFRESNDYAVHIVSNTEGASEATHTFCHCSLMLYVLRNTKNVISHDLSY